MRRRLGGECCDTTTDARCDQACDGSIGKDSWACYVLPGPTAVRATETARSTTWESRILARSSIWTLRARAGRRCLSIVLNRSQTLGKWSRRPVLDLPMTTQNSYSSTPIGHCILLLSNGAGADLRDRRMAIVPVRRDSRIPGRCLQYINRHRPGITLDSNGPCSATMIA